jgi:hypothetical protein
LTATVTILAFLFFSCNFGAKSIAKNQQTTIEALQWFLADGVVLDDQRPMAGILSEQEVLLKAADIAVSQGVLDPSYYLYKKEPALWTAKIETPILVHDPSGEPSVYMLHAVDEEGNSLMEVFVKSEENIDTKDFVATLFTPTPNPSRNYKANFITKREVNEYARRRFPGKNISAPVAVANLFLEGSRHSNSQIFWYFQVGDQNGSVASNVEEYIIDVAVMGNRLNENGRSLISNAYRGSPHLGGYRMAKLTPPLNFQYYTRDASMDIFANSANTTLTEPIGFIGVPLE